MKTKLFKNGFLIGLLAISPLYAISQDVNNPIDTYVKVYDLAEHYPGFNYDYVYDENGDLVSVEVTGVSDKSDKEKFELWLVDLKKSQLENSNKKDELGIYLYTETGAVPKDGYEKLYHKLNNNLTYPEDAKDNGVDGVIYVRFVVDENGKVSQTNAIEHIDSPYKQSIADMKEEAINAVKATSGEWKPATVDGRPVAEWLVLPVKFDFKYNPSLIEPIE